MKKIPLTQGKFALVDDEDYLLLSQFRWRVAVGTYTSYATTKIKTHNKWIALKMHRLIMNPPTGMQVDHINHNGLDNRRKNLRVCTQSQNSMNQRPQKGTSSQFKGVSWIKESKKWSAHIKIHQKLIHLGYFFSEIEAAKGYDTAAGQCFGEFAHLNFPVVEVA